MSNTIFYGGRVRTLQDRSAVKHDPCSVQRLNGSIMLENVLKAALLLV